MCLYKRLIQNRKFTANKKNGGVIPAVYDKRTLAVPIACGQCIECKKRKANDWVVRLTEHIKYNTNGTYVTLTFSEESLKALGTDIHKSITGYERENAIATLAVRRFTERWRKKYETTVKHWLVTELGTTRTERIHLHGLVFSKDKEEIHNMWKYGYTRMGTYVNEKTIGYITKYILKTDIKHKHYKPKVLSSKGMGKEFLKSEAAKLLAYKGKNTRDQYTKRNGHRIALPIYYRNHLYDEIEREVLWITKLDEEKIFIMGREYDLKDENKQYLKALKAAQEKSKRLGYGTNQPNWNEKEYEEQRRKLLQAR